MPANEIGSRYAFPGSYPIRAATPRSVVMDLVTDLGDGGFRQIVLLSLHGGPMHNSALDDAAKYFNDTYGGRMIHVTGLAGVQGAAPSDLLSAGQRAREGFSVHADSDEHGRVLFLRPDLVASDRASAPAVTGHDMKDLRAIAARPNWSGYFGSPSFATAAAGSRAMNAIARAAVDAVLKVLDGAPIQTMPRIVDVLSGDPEIREILAGSTEHEREVERRESEWLAKQRR
jgi:creatinine amidohydrolase/Fe(II)-dependent formamide hydrolase-like protein